jgi:hypothetical protein
MAIIRILLFICLICIELGAIDTTLRKIPFSNTDKILIFIKMTGAGEKVHCHVFDWSRHPSSVVYRVKFPQGTSFRIWATQCLKECLNEGKYSNQSRQIGLKAQRF